ncbi:hypothetical protein DYU11_07250 [Fibrisoma montanum]|uniref:Uncharacterized protein n=1 Tax=Fibrisoma montanum TaxID=2305895 RepID=A0A418ME81_9BACT|nr:hypothetical protein [Fibrisoma montanum]RIV25108.1 hypothetical protein DYU11_07250 [Fibrisoma montanum]
MDLLTAFAQLPELVRSFTQLQKDMADIKSRIDPHPDILTVPAIVERSGFSPNVVRSWINEGRRIPGTNRVEKLRIMDGITDGPYRIRWEEWRRWLALFPDIQA